MQYVAINDYVYMKAKPLLLRSKVRTSANVLLQNPEEFESFVKTKGLTKSQATAITASLYNSNFIHNAIFVNIAKLAMRQVLESMEEILPWTSKINPGLHPIYVNLSNYSSIYNF